MKKFVLIFLLISFFRDLSAQDSSGNNKQVWPEVDVYYRLNDRFRFYGKIASTRLNEANTDGSMGAYLDFFTFPWVRGKLIHHLIDTAKGSYLWIRTGYSYSQSPPGAPKVVDESIIVTEINALYYLPGDILLTNANRFDWLFDNSHFDPRYRLKLKFDRNFSTQYLFFNFYFLGEYYFYFNQGDQDRFRMQVGYEVKVTKFLNLETYYLHQFNNDGTIDAVDAVGLQANLYFRKQKKRK